MTTLRDADRAAAQALAEVNASARSQLRVLSLLQAVVEATPDDGVLRGLAAQFREDRRAAFVRFHERILRNERGDLDGRALEDAFDEAIAFTVGVEGDGEEAAALRKAKAEAVVAPSKQPVPFFARFLEGQRR